MKVGELFVNLGIKGADKAVGSLTSVRETMKTITSTSLETKAAIAGVFYGLQQLIAGSNAYGLSLQQFANRTGISGDLLQRWSFLMRQGGVSAEETMKSVEGLQQVMTKIQTENISPKGMTAVANVLGEKNFDPIRAGRDMGYLLDKLREYARKAKDSGAPQAIIQQVLSGFNLTPNFIAEMTKSSVLLNKIKPSELYTGKETSTLANMAVGWLNLGNQIEKAIGRLNIQFGPALLRDLQKLVPQVLALVKAFADMAVKLHVIQGIGKVFEGWTMIFRELTTQIQDFNKNGLKNFIPGDWLKFFGKELLNPTPVGTPDVSKSQTVTVNTTVNTGAVAATGDLVAAIGAEIGRVVNDTMRGLQPQGNGI